MLGRATAIRKEIDTSSVALSTMPPSASMTMMPWRLRLRSDADTEGVLGTPPVTETILKKIGASDIFVPDLTFIAQTGAGKLTPNPNVMAEYGYALHALTFEAMMPVMNTHYGAPTELPFDLGHVRHPTQYDLPPASPDEPRGHRGVP
jgi:hypothetical protein